MFGSFVNGREYVRGRVLRRHSERLVASARRVTYFASVIDSVEPDFALDAYLLSQEVVVATGAAFTCVVSVVLVSKPLVWVIAGIAGIGAGLAAAWLFIRGRRFRTYDGLAAVTVGPQRPRRVASRAGAARGLVLLAVLLVVVVAETYVFGLDVLRLAGPLLVALSCALEYSRRSLLSWQSEHQMVVCTRVGSRTFAWTRAGARAALVLAPAPASTA